MYRQPPRALRSPPRVSSTSKATIVGSPDDATISTSYVERLNLLTRMKCRRLMRLVYAFSRKAENLRGALQVHLTAYNFVKRHSSLKGGITPAMALGVTDRLWKIDDLVDHASERLARA